MWASFVTAGMAVFLPWTLRKRHKSVPAICAITALGTFITYQYRLRTKVPDGILLFQMELYLLVPLLGLALASCSLVAFLRPKDEDNTS